MVRDSVIRPSKSGRRRVQSVARPCTVRIPLLHRSRRYVSQQAIGASRECTAPLPLAGALLDHVEQHVHFAEHCWMYLVLVLLLRTRLQTTAGKTLPQREQQAVKPRMLVGGRWDQVAKRLLERRGQATLDRGQ